MSGGRKNYFEAGGEGYARFRPRYPEALIRLLASIAPCRSLALDIGCGSGQLTIALAEYFDEVIGVDPSDAQLSNAPQHARVSYRRAGAEALGDFDRPACLITAAQAAHWFELPLFYEEVRRVAAKNAYLALITYGLPELDDARLNARFRRFNDEALSRHWPPERGLVDSKYAGLYFPFEEREAPALTMEHRWTLNEFSGYLSTWSAFRRARQKAHEKNEPPQNERDERGERDDAQALFRSLEQLLREAWGGPERRRLIRWPLTLRLGLID